MMYKNGAEGSVMDSEENAMCNRETMGQLAENMAKGLTLGLIMSRSFHQLHIVIYFLMFNGKRPNSHQDRAAR